MEGTENRQIDSVPIGFFPFLMILKSLLRVFAALNAALLVICAYSVAPDFRSEHPAASIVAATTQRPPSEFGNFSISPAQSGSQHEKSF